MSSGVNVPRILRGDPALEAYSRDVQNAIRALANSAELSDRGRATTYPFRSIPQGDDTVRISKGRITYHKGNDPMTIQTVEIDTSSAITVTDGQTIYGTVTMDPDAETIQSDGHNGTTSTTYHALPNSGLSLTFAYSAAAALPTASLTDFAAATIPATFDIHWPIAKFKVASSVATVQEIFTRENIVLPYFVFRDATS